MKRLLILFTSFAVLSSMNAQISFNTGSADFDADLNIINTNAKADLTAFKTDLTVSFGVPLATVDNMLSMSMAPAEVYLALEIGKTVGKPIEDVLVVYKANKGKGWGVIAQEMGIKPGSDLFHALKGKCTDKKNKGNSGNKGNSQGKGKSKN